MSKGNKNVVKGNAVVGVQMGRVRGGIKPNGAGAFIVDGKSVGTPGRAPCGCPGAETFSQVKGGRQCVRCSRVY